MTVSLQECAYSVMIIYFKSSLHAHCSHLLCLGKPLSDNGAPNSNYDPHPYLGVIEPLSKYSSHA